MPTAQAIPADAHRGRGFATQVAELIRRARQEGGMTVDQLDAALGSKDSKTISAI
jgi:ribosome-binding protein aMBF1 (putative translation factor)